MRIDKRNCPHINRQTKQSNNSCRYADVQQAASENAYEHSPKANKNIFYGQQTKHIHFAVSKQGINPQFFHSAAHEKVVRVEHIKHNKRHDEYCDYAAHHFYAAIR